MNCLPHTDCIVVTGMDIIKFIMTLTETGFIIVKILAIKFAGILVYNRPTTTVVVRL